VGGFRPCKSKTICPDLAPPGKKYCPKHEGEERENVLLYDRERNKYDPIRKLHNSRRWRKGTAQAVLRRDILCEGCGRAPATEADHIENAPQDLELVITQPTSSLARVAQDLELVVTQPTSTRAVVMQDMLLVVFSKYRGRAGFSYILGAQTSATVSK
jgi:hypothetical protein